MAGVAFAVEGDGVGFATESYAASALYTTLASLSAALWRIRRASLVASLLFKYLVVPIIMTSVLGGILRFAFNKLKKGKEIIAFAVGSFLLFAMLMVIV